MSATAGFTMFMLQPIILTVKSGICTLPVFSIIKRTSVAVVFRVFVRVTTASTPYRKVGLAVRLR